MRLWKRTHFPSNSYARLSSSMTIEEFICSTNLADNVEMLFHILENVLCDMGFDRVLLALLTAHPNLRMEARHGYLKNYPEDWVKYYLERGYDAIDPVRSLAFARTGAYTWQEIIDSMSLSKYQILMFNEAEEAQLYHGIGVAMRGTGGAVAGLGIASTQKGVDTSRVTLDKVNLIAQQFYVCFTRLMAAQPTVRSVMLNARESEILKWSARGFSRADISERLHISLHTVDFHIRNAMKKLDAKNITAAVVMALNMGLIQI
jgi:DNA-binding CsgD family transcriptional regulator